jgi:uncharacterized membrane protein YgcG
MSWRQHHGATPAPLESSDDRDLKFKPGMTGAEQKARAKELRKYAEQRGQLRELEREKKKEEKRPAAAAAAAAVAATSGEVSTAAASPSPSPRRNASGSSMPTEERPVCSFFLEGKCVRGTRCKFRHEAPTATSDSAEHERAKGDALDVVQVLSADLWLHVLAGLDISSLCSVSLCCASLAAIASSEELWAQMHLKTFGEEYTGTAAEGGGGGGGGSSSSGNLHSPRLACCRSEVELRSWAKASCEAPVDLQLSPMSAVAVAGNLGVSTHEAKMLRLWEARSGRRLACKTLKHSPLSLHAQMIGERRSSYDSSGTGAMAVVGDAAGALHVIDLDDELDAATQRRPFTPRATLHTVPSRLEDVDRTSPFWTTALCSAVVLCWSGSPEDEQGEGRDNGGGGGIDGGEGGGGEVGGGDGDAHGGDEERGGEGREAGLAVCVASAYRDGTVALSRLASGASGARQLVWQGTL